MAISRSRFMPGKMTTPAFMSGSWRKPGPLGSWRGSTRRSSTLLGAGEEPYDGLPNGGRRRTVLVGVCVGSHHLRQEVRCKVGRRADAARWRGRELQVVDTGDVAQAQAALCWFRRMTGCCQLPRGHLLPALLRGLRMSTHGDHH